MVARFDIEPLQTRTNLILSVDAETLARYREDEKGARFLSALQKARIFGIEEAHHQDVAVISVRSSSLTRYKDAPVTTVKVLHTLYNLTEAAQTMPQVAMSQEVLDRAANRYGMMVELRWPEATPLAAATFATRHMQRFAQSIDLNGSQAMNTANDMVYVAASREQGIIIETNPVGSCNISAGGYGYDSKLDTVELWQHNIYSPGQQLACLMGAVSFATADLHGVDK